MRQLRFVGLDEDGVSLVCADEAGEQYMLPVDGRLRSAVRQDRPRLGQVEAGAGESALRPREIPARIRAGETAEQVATAAGVPVERVRRFEGPVLRERERMASDARSARLRRTEEGPWPVLGDIVEDRLRVRGVDPATVDWDAWRRDDSSWTVVLRFHDGANLTTAQWGFAPLRRQVVPLDDVARVLSEPDRPVPAVAPPLAPELPVAAAAGMPRGPAALRSVTAGPVPEVSLPYPDEPAPADATETADAHGTAPGDAEGDPHGDLDIAETAGAAPAAGVGGETAAPVAAGGEPSSAGSGRPAGAARRKKATVPAWDDIVFGSRRTP